MKGLSLFLLLLTLAGCAVKPAPPWPEGTERPINEPLYYEVNNHG